MIPPELPDDFTLTSILPQGVSVSAASAGIKY